MLEDVFDTFKEVTLEELLNLENCSWVGDGEDNIWQLYFVQTGKTMNDGYFVKIKKDIVMRYLDEKDKQKRSDRYELS